MLINSCKQHMNSLSLHIQLKSTTFFAASIWSSHTLPCINSSRNMDRFATVGFSVTQFCSYQRSINLICSPYRKETAESLRDTGKLMVDDSKNRPFAKAEDALLMMLQGAEGVHTHLWTLELGVNKIREEAERRQILRGGIVLFFMPMSLHKWLSFPRSLTIDSTTLS